MYEAMRQRAPGSSKLAGVTSAILITGLAGYALANGVGGEIVKLVPPAVTLTTLRPPAAEPPKPTAEIPVEKTGLSIPEPLVVTPTFTIGPSPIVVPPAPPVGVRPSSPAGVVPAGPSRTGPKLRSMNKPPYPASEIRARNEGDSSLDVCVSAAGRVTAATLARSSGHPRLDDAALKWVRNARFTPGAVNGAPQSMCGHSVVYEWRLEDAAR